MSLLGLAFAAAVSGAEPCSAVRREQAAFTAKIFDRMERMNRDLRRPDGSQRPLTAAQRKEFAGVEAEVEAFIDRFNTRLNQCREN
ncbi:hypothetical protein H9L13_00805 [Sphingomonas lutea]|uniref:Uncharacterized protein n=1 Tax=Sphingomonas lutea TaxID=1045317 RepID=A0A7G9SI63_9SPHN|nr:hypothetical protein [Sphingomonas lutea]QNN67538.1 hypothetical protein H9L13_00805 [Sphingomonas lutea]